MNIENTYLVCDYNQNDINENFVKLAVDINGYADNESAMDIYQQDAELLMSNYIEEFLLSETENDIWKMGIVDGFAEGYIKLKELIV